MAEIDMQANANLPASGDSRGLGRMARVPIGTIALMVGLCALTLPTLARLARWSWSTELGAHGPIVLISGMWLIWHDRALAQGAVARPLFPTGLVAMLLLPAYCLFGVTGTLMGEALALYLILLTVAYLRLGTAVLRRFWFPCVYLLFILTPPALVVSVATRPIKEAISRYAVDLLSLLGLPVGSTGSIIQIDGYQMQVAAACSGINSLIGITAVTLFYVYLLHGSQLRYATVLTLLLVPVAIVANFLRVILLVLLTHWFGQGAVEGAMHDAAALGLFALALALLVSIDTVLYPLFRRLGWTRS